MLYYTAKQRILPSSPNNYYREQMQALINSQWDNTTMLQTIDEEYPFASFEFREVEVRMIHALDKSTRQKQGDDFLHEKYLLLLYDTTASHKEQVTVRLRLRCPIKSSHLTLFLDFIDRCTRCACP